MRSGLILIAGALVLGFASASDAGQIIEGSQFSHGNWRGAAVTVEEGEDFSHCYVRASYSSGDRLIFELGSNGEVSIGVENMDWRLEIGQRFHALIQIDQMAPFYEMAISTANTQAAAGISDSNRAFREIQHGKMMTIAAEDWRGSYNLAGTSGALEKAKRCVYQFKDYPRMAAGIREAQEKPIARSTAPSELSEAPPAEPKLGLSPTPSTSVISFEDGRFVSQVLNGDEFRDEGISKIEIIATSGYCAEAQPAVLRAGRYRAPRSFLSTASPGDLKRCNGMPLSLRLAAPARSVRISFYGANTLYELRAYRVDGSLVESRSENADPYTYDENFSVAVSAPSAEIVRFEFGREAALTMVRSIEVDHGGLLGSSRYDDPVDPPPDLVLGRAAGEEVAGPVWGPDIVLNPSIRLGYMPCPDSETEREVRRCLSELGLSEEGIEFAFAYDPENTGEIVAISFTELGKVDLVTVNLPYAPWFAPVLVNGEPNLIRVEGTRLSAFADSASRSFLSRYPGANTWILGVIGHRTLPSGGQRFVLGSVYTDFCRACQVIGIAVSFLDFSTEGREVEQRAIGLMDMSRFDDPLAVDWSAAELANNPRSLQYRLNSLGYEAGSMDGVLGRKTREALSAFQKEHCLLATGEPNNETKLRLSQVIGLEKPCAQPKAGIIANSTEPPLMRPRTAGTRSSLPSVD